MEFIKELPCEDTPKSKYVIFVNIDTGNSVSKYIEEREIIREFDENQIDDLRQFIIYWEVLESAYSFGRREKDNYNEFKFVDSHFKELVYDSLGRRDTINGYEVIYYDELSRRCDVYIEFSKEDLDEIESHIN